MPGNYNENIQNEFWKEKVEIVEMRGSTIAKTHTRTVEITRALDQPTLLLSKNGKVRESLQFIEVYELEISRPSNLIRLVCSNQDIVTIRVKSRESLERWLVHLKKSLPRDSRGNFRERAATENHKLRGQHSRTPRRTAEVQSVIFPERSIISPSTNAQNLLEPLADDEYEIPTAFASLRSNDVYPTNTDQQPIYQRGAEISNHGNSDLHAVVSVEIKIGHTKKPPQPPPKPYSHRPCNPPNGNDANQGPVATCGWNTSNRRDICLPTKELVNELTSVVSKKSANSGDNHTPSIHPNRPTHPRPAMRLPSEPKIEDEDYYTLAAPCVNTGNAAADRRQASRRGPVDRQRMKPASEDQEPNSSSSSDESDEPQYMNVGNSIYLKRSTLSSEMEEESICVEVEKSKLLDLKIKTTSDGPCISQVPPGLRGKFYHGDKILDINEQRIPNTDFAYSIIETSKNDMVKVTVKRLIRGYFVELHRINPEEGLGFSLTDGPVITSVSPGTDFARKANCAMMERMVITHVNGLYIPLNSETRQVNMTIRNAGSRFFVILQPLYFMTELTGNTYGT